MFNRIEKEKFIMFYSLEEEDEYPCVEYNDKKDPWRDVKCPKFASHTYQERNAENLSIVIKRNKMGNFISNVDGSAWLITDNTAKIFKKLKLTGYNLREVDVSNKVLPFKLWEIIVVGKAKTHPDSGIKEIYHCEHCNLLMHIVSKNKALIIDEKTWDGSDFFKIETGHAHIFVSEKVKEAIKDNKLTGVLLVPSNKIKLGSSAAGLGGAPDWSKEQWKKIFEPSESNGLEYEKFRNGIRITSYEGHKKNIIIPEKLDNLPVVAIGESSFRHMTNVVFPDSVTSIGQMAFYRNNLTSVTLPKSLKTIGISAFCHNKLTSITIPNSVTSIGDYAFADNKLTSVTIPSSVKKIGKEAFDKKVSVKTEERRKK